MKPKADFNVVLRSIIGRDIPDSVPEPVLTDAEKVRLRARPDLLEMAFQDIVDAGQEQVSVPQSMPTSLKFDEVVPVTADLLRKRAQDRTPVERPPGAIRVEVVRSGRPASYATAAGLSLVGRLILDAASMPSEELAKAIARNLRHRLLNHAFAIGGTPEPEVVVINVESIRAPQQPKRYGAPVVIRAGRANKVISSSATDKERRRELLLKRKRLLIAMVQAKLPSGQRSSALVRKIKFESVDS